MSSRKLKKDEINKGAIEKGCSGVKSCVKKYIDDVDSISISKQIILGTTSGCITGLLSAKVGKVLAIAVGSSIILLQVANHNGYIRINWDKVNRNVDKVVDKVEEQLTGEGPSWMDKVERYVDSKIDKTEDIIKSKQVKAKGWYTSFMGESTYRLKEIHVFLISFAAGVAIGVAAS